MKDFNTPFGSEGYEASRCSRSESPVGPAGVEQHPQDRELDAASYELHCLSNTGGVIDERSPLSNEHGPIVNRSKGSLRMQFAAAFSGSEGSEASRCSRSEALAGSAGVEQQLLERELHWISTTGGVTDEGSPLTDVHEVIVNRSEGSLRMQFAAAFSATLLFFMGGCCLGWSSPTLARLESGKDEPHITSDEKSWIVSFLLIGLLISPFIGGYVVDLFGRKPTLLFTSVPFFIAWVMFILAETVGVLYIARFFAGLGLGLAFTVVPMYMGEIAESHIRGALGTLFQVMLNLGLMFEYCVAPYVSISLLGILSGIFPIIFVITFVWMPESPYYFLLKNRRQVAENSLLRLRCVHKLESVRKELDAMEANVEMFKSNKAGIKDLIMSKGNRKALFILTGLLVIQNFSGINAILSYATGMFEKSSSSLDANVSVMVIGAVQIALSVVASALVDVAGRRAMLLLSSAGCAITLFAEGLYFHLRGTLNDEEMAALDWLPITAFVLYLVLYTLGLGPLPLAMLGELFPTTVKGLAASISTIIIGLTALLVTKLYTVVEDEFGTHVVFWAFAVCCAFGTLFVAFIVPETKGKTFTQISEELAA